MRTKHLLFYITSLLAFTATAEKVEVDGIFYNIGNGTAEVTFRGDEEDGWMYFSYDELYTGDVVIPESISYNGSDYKVTSIGNDAFAGSRAMTSLELPSTVSAMGSGIFSLCNSLGVINVAEENTSFFSYEGLLYTKKDAELYYVPKAVWGDVSLYDGITTIPSSAFQNCTGLTTISIPESVTTIADGAFYGCTNLEDVFLNEGLTSIGEYAFGKCESLQTVNFPESLRTIKSCAFADCTGLFYALLHDGITSIGKMAFYNCSNLIGIELPTTLTSIADQAFMGCVNLSSVKNDSKLNIVLGSESNGYVAYYAKELVTPTVTLLTGSNNFKIYQTTSGIIINNADGSNYALFDYNGRLLKKGICTSNSETVDTNGKRVIVSLQ